MTIRLVTLDLDNTLWDVDSIIRQAEADLRAWLADHAPTSLAHYQPDTLATLREGVVAANPERRHDLSFMRTAVLEAVMVRAGYGAREAAQQARRAFDVFFEGRNRVVFFPGALSMLEALQRDYRLVALTNGNADVHRAGIGDFLHGAYSSADVGASKPDARMFMTPLRELGLAAHEAVHVGDHLVDDVQGANQAGMHSIWVNLKDAAAPEDAADKPSREVRHLEAVAEAVAELADQDPAISTR